MTETANGRPDGAFGVIVTLDVRPERKAEMLEQMARVHEAMRDEPTFIASTIYIDADDPYRIVVHEQWRDRRDFEEVQMRRPYRREREDCLPNMVRRPREMRFYEIVRDQRGATV